MALAAMALVVMMEVASAVVAELIVVVVAMVLVALVMVGGGAGLHSGGGATGSAHPLLGKRYRLVLDIGREKHTWMDQRWAASGRRVEVPIVAEFGGGGVLHVLGIGAFSSLQVSGGSWHTDGDTLRLVLQTGGFARGDVSLAPGPLHASVPCWGGLLSRDKGTLTVRQTRWLVRKESRLVGRLRAAEVPAGDEASAWLQPSRTKVGGLDGPVYHGYDKGQDRAL